MPLPAYLQDPDLQNYLGASNDDEEDNPQNVPGQLQPPAVGQLPAPPPPTPEMLKLLNSSTIPKVAPPPPPPSDLDNAQAALTASQANRSALAQQRPALPQPKWWQRLAAGAAGGLAGYENAAGRIRRPIDASGIEQGILQGNYPRQEKQWEQNVGAADADVQAQQAKLDTIAKIRQLNTQDQLQKSEIDKNAAEGTYYSGRNDAATQGKKDADNERWEAALIKGREEEAAYQKEGQPVPAGYEAIPSLVHPGYVIVVPPHVVPLPKDLAPYVPGRAVGDPIPYGEFKKAQAAAQQDLIKNTNKPAPPEKIPTEVSLAVEAAHGDPKLALKLLADQKRAGAPAVPGLTEAAIQQAADLYRQTGAMPNLGMGSSGTRIQILNKAGEGGGDIAANKQDYKSTSGSLATLQRTADQVGAFESTATANLDLANSVSQQVDRTGSPLANRYLLYLKSGVGGDADTTKLQNAVTTAATEYAKVIGGGTGSAGATDSMRKETEAMLNAAMSKGTFSQVVAQMKQEMANRHAGFQKQLQDIHSRRTGAVPQQQPAPPPVQQPTGKTYAHIATNPSTGHKLGSDDGVNWYDIQTGHATVAR